ncbi:MAG: hypothetical protein ABL904_13630 [Hyphomicrobiaceae bacterium]
MGDAIATPMRRSRLKQAELLSAVGALVLGIGIGALAAPVLGWLAVPIFLIGCISHGWGMIQKHRIEQLDDNTPATWEAALYWGCWVALAIVLAVASWRAVMHA